MHILHIFIHSMQILEAKYHYYKLTVGNKKNCLDFGLVSTKNLLAITHIHNKTIWAHGRFVLVEGPIYMVDPKCFDCKKKV